METTDRSLNSFYGDRLFERGPTVLRVFLHDDLVRLAAEHRLSPQSLVREINPRMRPWPSANARRGHSGPWLVTVAEDETGAIGRFGDEGWFHFNDSNILTEHEKFARYWPCDANGNKVRWPTDEHGNLL